MTYYTPELPPLPTMETITPNKVTPSTNTDHTITQPSPSTVVPSKAADDNFCATKAGGIYAKPDAPGSFYNCANGITWVQNCPATLVFQDSCKCCAWP